MIKFYLTALLCLTIFATQAQSTFIKQLAATGIKKVLATDDGGYLVTTNYNILKYNSDDSLLWNKTVSDSATMYFQQAIVLKNGGYAFLCKSGAAPHTDAEVIKLDNNLKVIWQKRLFGDIPLCIAEDWSGNLLTGGLNEDETDHSFIIKLDANGNGLWLKYLADPTSNAFLSNIKISADKKYITAGENFEGGSMMVLDSNGIQVTTNAYELNSPLVAGIELFKNSDVLFLPATEDGIARMNEAGAITWKKTLTTPSTKIYFQSANIIDNGMLLGGFKTGNSDIDSTLIIAAFSSAGKCAWFKQIAMPSRTTAISIAKLKNGSYIIAAAGSPYFNINHGTSYLVKLNASGNGCNSTKLSFTETDAVFTARITKPFTGTIVNFQNPKMIVSTIYTSPSISICGNVLLQPQENISQADSKATTRLLKLSAYPNPVSNNLNLSFTSAKAEKSLLQIFDITGNLMMQLPLNISVGKNVQLLNVAALRNGAYTIQLTNNNAILKTTFYKQY